MLVHRVTSSGLAHALKAAVICSTGLVVLLSRSDEDGDVWRTFLVEAAAYAALFGAFLLVFTALWLWRRAPGPVPADARLGSFADAVRPDWLDLLLVAVVIGSAFLASSDLAALVAGIGVGTGLAAAAQAILVRGWESRLDSVLYWRRDWSWRFPPLYSVSRD